MAAVILSIVIAAAGLIGVFWLVMQEEFWMVVGGLLLIAVTLFMAFWIYVFLSVLGAS